MIEEYWGTTPYPTEDNLKKGNCRVRLQIAPHDDEEPGLRIYYAYKDSVSALCILMHDLN
jgi:hypothetical protein